MVREHYRDGVESRRYQEKIFRRRRRAKEKLKKKKSRYQHRFERKLIEVFYNPLCASLVPMIYQMIEAGDRFFCGKILV